MNCPKCSNPVPEANRTCPTCETDVGFPNVREVEKTDNVIALEKRFKEAEISTQARSCYDILISFGEETKKSKAVICMPLNAAIRILKENQLISTFYQQREAGIRMPQNNAWDSARESVETKLFPHYHMRIQYGFLSLDNAILEHFGECGLILKDDMIAQRTTVLEKNAVIFIEEHRIFGRNPIPGGYRAVWARRNMLAMAKHHPNVDEATKPQDFPKILNCDQESFMEVHIYGTLNLRSIEKFIVRNPAVREQRLLLESFRESLNKTGVPLEIIP